VLAGLLLVAALLATTSFTAWQELRLAVNARSLERSQRAAEAGLAAALAAWGVSGLRGAESTASLQGELPNDAGAYSVSVAPLGSSLFLLRSVGWAGGGRVSREVGLLVHQLPLSWSFDAVVTTSETVTGVSLIDPVDRSPPGWDCTWGGTDTVAAAREGVVEPWWSGELGWDDLAGIAWDTLDATEQLPASGVFLVRGDLVLDGGSRDGVLMVEGSLTLRGRARYAGVLMVRDEFRVSPPDGAEVWGVVLALSATIEAGPGPGLPAVVYSACALARAAALGGGLGPVRERPFLDLR
jgi:hypothetical protein